MKGWEKMVPGLIFIFGCLSIVLFFVHVNQKWGLVYTGLKYFAIFLIAVYIINLIADIITEKNKMDKRTKTYYINKFKQNNLILSINVNYYF